ncbi:MAG: hypothetical protein JO363_19915, partial [Solirubrobacterales bacterium]|nr:hypothetical protein [Solirubrobacterales bacterium]
EAGIGKTALLEYAVAAAADLEVCRVVGVQSEMELAFAALHQLLIPFLGHLERLPEPQRAALASTFGLTEGSAPTLFLVGLATLTLLADAASGTPMLCVVDDAQWLDGASADVLGFVARRLFADGIGMLFAVRETPDGSSAFAGLSELPVTGLSDDDARALLASVATGHVDQPTLARIVAQSRGNPLALMELGAGLSSGELAGRFPSPDPLPVGKRLEERFLSQVRALPADTQLVLLLAAAQEPGDTGHLWRAAAQLGISPDAADRPELERLITFEPTVGFRHPLMRSAVYQGASEGERRRVHTALAAATDPERDPDRRAWHLAAAALGPDEQVAAELERAADRARARGGWASGAAFLARASELTPEPHRRAERELAAAEAKFIAGDPDGARRLLARAGPHLVDLWSRARARRLEGEIGFATLSLQGTSAILLDAARAFAPLDPIPAREALFAALQAAQLTNSSESCRDVLQAARKMALGPDSDGSVPEFFLHGYAAQAEGRHRDAAVLFRRAIGALHVAPDLRWFGSGFHAAWDLLDHQEAMKLLRRWVQLARDQGALTSLATAFAMVALGEVFSGRFSTAEAIDADTRDMRGATGQPPMSPSELATMALRGRVDATQVTAGELRQEYRRREFGMGSLGLDLCLVWLEIGLGNYESALTLALGIYKGDPVNIGTWVLPEMVEAAVRCGDRQAASAAIHRLSPRAVAGGAPWGLGLLARSKALLADDTGAEACYQEAIDHLKRSDTATDLARAHLLYGEWLRRQRRRRDAREQLRTAHDMFDSMGAEAFAGRARTELLATGEHPRQRSEETRDELTPQEERVARLASQGATNQDIAAQMFISPATVAYHLRKVFQKLEVTNRAQVQRALDQRSGGSPEAAAPPVSETGEDG